MELDEIRTFVAVADAGSVNRAAHVRHLSQPAVTRQVQRLEAALGVPLLDRRAKPAGLTAAGRVALEQCRAVLKAVEALRSTTAGDGPAGECRIGVPPSLADLALPGAVDHLRRLFPRVKLLVTTGWSRALLEQVRAGSLDAALVQLPEGDQPPADVARRAIGAQPLVFVAPRRTRLAPSVRIEDLAGARWVLNPDGCGFRAALRRALQRIDMPLDVAVEAYGSDVQLSLVARGIGFGCVPARALATSPVRRDLRTFQVEGYDLRLTVWAVRGRTLEALVPVLEALEAHLAQVFEPSPRRRPRPRAARSGGTAAPRRRVERGAR
jgi:DNA-binding transcriptional LysR family regulator